MTRQELIEALSQAARGLENEQPYEQLAAAALYVLCGALGDGREMELLEVMALWSQGEIMRLNAPNN